jgi:hypothetical protein
MNVVEQEHLPTSMQPLAMPRLVFPFRPQPTHHATARSIDARRPTVPGARERVRPAPAHPRRVTPLARLHRDEAAVLRWQGPRRGSRPASGDVRRESPRPPSPRHARCMRAPQNAAVRAGNGRAAAPARACGSVRRERRRRPTSRVGKCVARATLPPSPRHARCVRAPRWRAMRAGNGRAAAPAPARRIGRRDNDVPPAARRPVALTSAVDETAPPALPSANTPRA